MIWSQPHARLCRACCSRSNAAILCPEPKPRNTMSEWGGVLLTTARRVRKQTWLTALHVDVRAVPFTAAPPPEMIVEAQVGSACCQRACVRVVPPSHLSWPLPCARAQIGMGRSLCLLSPTPQPCRHFSAGCCAPRVCIMRRTWPHATSCCHGGTSTHCPCAASSAGVA